MVGKPLVVQIRKNRRTSVNAGQKCDADANFQIHAWGAALLNIAMHFDLV